MPQILVKAPPRHPTHLVIEGGPLPVWVSTIEYETCNQRMDFHECEDYNRNTSPKSKRFRADQPTWNLHPSFLKVSLSHALSHVSSSPELGDAQDTYPPSALQAVFSI
jgi:hypothetical protein